MDNDGLRYGATESALRRAGGSGVWIVSTYGPGAERDWTTFFNFIMTGETADT